MRLRVLILLAALALLWPARSALAQDPSAAEALLSYINDARAANGLPPYTLNPLLSAAAQAHSEDMAAQAALLLSQGQDISGAVTHTGSDGSRAADRVAAAGYAAIQVGENIYASRSGPEAAFNWWMGSAPHRHNILHDRYREIGVGVASGPEGLVLYTLVFAYNEDSPVLPAPTPPPTETVLPPTAFPTSTPTASATPSPAPTSTVARIQLPPVAAESPATLSPTVTAKPTATPAATPAPPGLASGVRLWVILLEAAAAAVAVYTIIKLRR